MAFTTDDITKLERAIARGHKVVRYGDRTVEYHTLKEMRAALAQMREEVNGFDSASRRKRVIRLTQIGRGQ